MPQISTINCLAALLTTVLAFTVSTGWAANKQKSITLNFEAVVGETPFVCGLSYSGIGLSKSRITPSDFRFFVSEIELIDSKGRAVPLQLEQDGVWQYRNVALLDFEDGTGPCLNGNTGIHTTISGTVPKRRYQGLQITIGLPDDLNHGDVTLAPPPLNVTSMFWTWRAGYKFVKLDMATKAFPQIPKPKSKPGDEKPAEPVEPEDSMTPISSKANESSDVAKPVKTKSKASGFSVHLGSTACDSPSRTTPPTVCHNPNRVIISFDEFDPDNNVIVVDVASLLYDTDVDYHAPNSAPGCMSDPKDTDCKSIMAGFGVPFNEQPAYPQRFLRIK